MTNGVKLDLAALECVHNVFFAIANPSDEQIVEVVAKKATELGVTSEDVMYYAEIYIKLRRDQLNKEKQHMELLMCA